MKTIKVKVAWSYVYADNLYEPDPVVVELDEEDVNYLIPLVREAVSDDNKFYLSSTELCDKLRDATDIPEFHQTDFWSPEVTYEPLDASELLRLMED